MENANSDVELGSIEAAASMEHWEAFIDFATEHIDLKVNDKSRGYKLHLALEELISNIIRAAESQSEAAQTQAMLEITALQRSEDESHWFVLRTRDTAMPFDPQFETRSPVDTAQDISERAIGGLGLFLIMESVDRVHYRWDNGRNVYELSTQLLDENSPPDQGGSG
jgi:anti-sigma regulatory factor (Ser/Thr protein kinase)